jgi:glyoxylase-like metal-dependent hydrolase (beta-lactamase superfamily II)
VHIDRCVLGIENIEAVGDGEEIAPGVTVVSLPGHDEGHVGLLVGTEAVIVADAVPHPAQLDHPEWIFGYDEDPQLAVETRRRILDEFADRTIYLSHAREGIRR